MVADLLILHYQVDRQYHDANDMNDPSSAHFEVLLGKVHYSACTIDVRCTTWRVPKEDVLNTFGSTAEVIKRIQFEELDAKYAIQESSWVCSWGEKFPAPLENWSEVPGPGFYWRYVEREGAR